MDQQAPTQTASTPAANTAPAPSQPPAKKKGGFFSLLGKLFLILILAGALLGGGYYLGNQTMKPDTTVVPLTAPTVTPTAAIPSPTTSSQKTKNVKAGLTGAALSFKPYSIEIPEGWTDVRENTQSASIDKLTITKTGYSLTIYQAAIGGGGCLYKGDKPADMAQNFTDFVDIKATVEQFRRSWNQEAAAKTQNYSVCQKAADDSFGSLTTFGAISAVSPNPADPTTLAEIDGMIASLKKQ